MAHKVEKEPILFGVLRRESKPRRTAHALKLQHLLLVRPRREREELAPLESAAFKRFVKAKGRFREALQEGCQVGRELTLRAQPLADSRDRLAVLGNPTLRGVQCRDFLEQSMELCYSPSSEIALEGIASTRQLIRGSVNSSARGFSNSLIAVENGERIKGYEVLLTEEVLYARVLVLPIHEPGEAGGRHEVPEEFLHKRRSLCPKQLLQKQHAERYAGRLRFLGRTLAQDTVRDLNNSILQFLHRCRGRSATALLARQVDLRRYLHAQACDGELPEPLCAGEVRVHQIRGGYLSTPQDFVRTLPCHSHRKQALQTKDCPLLLRLRPTLPPLLTFLRVVRVVLWGVLGNHQMPPDQRSEALGVQRARWVFIVKAWQIQ
mmetsp:Transcript_18471/g.52117  ORF Transcript_18471/g.52117 Transcript_18471/m.52117 type:complete len:378 (-) Transcript_18471:960-2093(-)